MRFTLFQHGYIQELLRTHGVKNISLDKVPITKELAMIPEGRCDERSRQYPGSTAADWRDTLGISKN